MKIFTTSLCAGLLMIGGAFAGSTNGEKKMAHEKPELLGVYAADTYKVTFMPEGLFAVSLNDSGAVSVIGKFGAKDGTFWVKTLAGGPPDATPEANACVRENKGKYSYTMDGDTLTMSVIDEACAGRAEVINGATLTKVALGDH